ncbi:EutN/CcmL family microcompartment protein [bacterium]|nr:EutN/CcmL family microcompartment protein [bacterium]
MNMARVIGSVWATRKHPSLEGYRLKIIQPVNSNLDNIGAPIVATDSIGAGQPHELVYYVTSGEAPIPLDIKAPTDATIIGIVDRIDR